MKVTITPGAMAELQAAAARIDAGTMSTQAPIATRPVVLAGGRAREHRGASARRSSGSSRSPGRGSSSDDDPPASAFQQAHRDLAAFVADWRPLSERERRVLLFILSTISARLAAEQLAGRWAA